MDKSYYHITEEVMEQFNDEDIKTFDAKFASKMTRQNKSLIAEKNHKDLHDAIKNIIDEVFEDDYFNRMIIKHIKLGINNFSLEPLKYLYSYNSLPGEEITDKERTHEKDIRVYINKRQNKGKKTPKVEHLEVHHREYIMIHNFHHYVFKHDLAPDLLEFIKEYFVTKFSGIYKNYKITFESDKNLTNDNGKITEITISWDVNSDENDEVIKKKGCTIM